MGVWDEAVSGAAIDRQKVILQTERRRQCFHFPNHSGMLYQAAKELQRRQSENEQLKRSNLYTRVGLWVAAGALVLNVVVEFLKLPMLSNVVKRIIQ
ncbi:hypothetical protein AQB9606_03447 [Aquabacterium sp. CECT 9606]|nr:hypothetical protein AQB9606_03447 [Aquabacterium sp. CECT 9606]